MKPQDGMVCSSAPLSRGPDGLEFWLQGTMLKVAPVSTKYLSFVSSSVRKMSPALAGKCIAVAAACAGLAAEPKMVRRQNSFPTKRRVECMRILLITIFETSLYMRIIDPHHEFQNIFLYGNYCVRSHHDIKIFLWPRKNYNIYGNTHRWAP